jgi:hypothetical protein
LQQAEGSLSARTADRDDGGGAPSLLSPVFLPRLNGKAWNLTATERKRPSLLLKGDGHKQILQIQRGASERCDNTPWRHIRKGGLGGQAALAAFFLERMRLSGGQTTPDVP